MGRPGFVELEGSRREEEHMQSLSRGFLEVGGKGWLWALEGRARCLEEPGGGSRKEIKSSTVDD